MAHKRVLLCITILLLVFPLRAKAQRQYYHDLRGMVDTAGVVHLYYGHYHSWINNLGYANLIDNVRHYNLSTRLDTVFLQMGLVSISGGGMINDYAFFNHEPGNYIYTSSMSNGVDIGSGIERCDSTGCTQVYGSNHVGFGNIGVADSSNRVYVAYGNQRSMISTDGGYHWEGVKDGMEGPDPFSEPDPDSTIPVSYLSVAPFNENLAFFDTTSGGNVFLKKTEDGGKTLSLVDTTSKGIWDYGSYFVHFFYDSDTLHIYSLVMAKRNGQLWYILRGSDQQGDAGSWETLFQDTTQIYVSLDPNESGALYLAHNNKIYKFTNYGTNIRMNKTPWQVLPVAARGIYKQPGKDIIYALTDSTLLKVTPTSIVTLQQIPTAIDQSGNSQKANQFVLYQNYPNPFNPATTICYELARSGQVRLTVYNMLGQEVSMLVDTQQPAGIHQVTFNASQLASGVYFYRLQSGEKILVRKMLVMK